MHITRAHPIEKLGQVQILRTDSVEWRKRAAQDVIKAPILMRTLHTDEVARFLDHADGRLIAPGVEADGAQLLFG